VPEMLLGQEVATRKPVQELVGRLVRRPPQLVITCARGSSAHAATFCKHLIEHQLGIPVCAAAPSIASIYGRELRLRGQLVLAISQSGTSDDLIAFARQARTAGALTVAVTNCDHSPLAASCELTLPISAGAEVSVAATKTFVATLSVLLRMVAAWAGDDGQEAALRALPGCLSKAMTLNWGAAVEALAETNSLAVIGRGPTLAIAREAALKLKETCNMHAEAFSGAEFMHGPVSLASRRYPILMFMPSDAALMGMSEVAAKLSQKGCRVLRAGGNNSQLGTAISLPSPMTHSAAADAICLVQTFYCMLVRLAARRGYDVDRPRNLQKITRTI
jgi:glutamine---fructose-6-phosphate transaminase (isomerizing)